MNKDLFENTFDSLPIMIAYIGADLKYKYANDKYSTWLGVDKKTLPGKCLVDVLGEKRYNSIKSHVEMALLGKDVLYEVSMPSETGFKVFFARYTSDIDDHEYVTGFSVLVEDITEKKEIETEKNELIIKFQEALANIKSLEGTIPICSYCHSIRDDEGAWDRLEAYITKHSHASFSHGVCPKCLAKARKDMGIKSI